MIDKTLYWIDRLVKEKQITGRTLDVGSRDFNGNPRGYFKDYVGFDMVKEKNVDVVGNAYELSNYFPPESFDNVLCLNVLEHVADISCVLSEIHKVLKTGGYFFCSMPSIGFHKHDYPSDYWRITEEGMREFIMRDYEIENLEVHITRANHFMIIDALGRKK